MLELLATVDPMAALMAGLWLFAAGMFPVGFMLGSSCSPCCGKCGCTDGKSLPDAVSVSFSGLTKGSYKSDNLLSVQFESCFGSGATATASAPGGNPETSKGPISSITLTNGGSGYAKLGRVAPTLTVTSEHGTGAALTPTLAQAQDACKLDYWKVSSVSVSGGTGYVDGEQLTFTTSDGDTQQQPATATIHTSRNEPTLTASASGGTGAAFSIAYTKNSGSPSTWSISGITVTNGGTGYSGGSSLNISLGADDVAVSEAYAYITTNRTQPTLSAGVSGTGSGASLTVSLSSGYGDEYGPTWTVSSIGITNGGSGYSEWDQVTVSVTDGQQSYWGWFDAYVTGVDENGAITAITVYYGGDYYKDGGVITGVNLYYGGGEYYKDDGVPTSVTVESGGIYYRQDASVPPYVADVTVTISQTAPSAGSGAEFSVTVDENPSSGTFGKITAVTVENGGDRYLQWYWKHFRTCVNRFNNKTFIVPKHTDCTYRLQVNAGCFGSSDVITVYYDGPTTKPRVDLLVQSPPSTLPFVSSSYVTDCSNLTFTASDPLGGSVSVAPTSETPGEHPQPGCCFNDNGSMVSSPIDDEDENAGDPICSPEECAAASGEWFDECPCYGKACPGTMEDCGGSFIISFSGESYCGTTLLASGSGDFTLSQTAPGRWEGSYEQGTEFTISGLPLTLAGGGYIQCTTYAVYRGYIELNYWIGGNNQETSTRAPICGSIAYGPSVIGPTAIVWTKSRPSESNSNVSCPHGGGTRYLKFLRRGPYGDTYRADGQITVTRVT